MLPREVDGNSTLEAFISKGVTINAYRELMPRMNDIFIKLVTEEEYAMNFKKIGIIIRREYLNRVKKKSFLIITFLAPILFAALILLPSLIMTFSK